MNIYWKLSHSHLLCHCGWMVGGWANSLRRGAIFLALMVLLGGVALAQTLPVTNSVVRFRTSAGDLEVELYDEAKPVTSANFIRYVEAGAYQNLFLHRLEPNFVLQAGGYRSPFRTATNSFDRYIPVPTFGTITNEFSVGPFLSNTNGTIAMAKLPGNTNSASSQWYFNLGDNSTNMDVQNGGFTVFGRVTSGTTVLDYFRGRSLSNGIVNLTNFYGAGAIAFENLPVRFDGFRLPQFKELEYVDISIVRTPAKPTVTISSPLADAILTNGAVTVRGKAADRVAVARVLVKLNGQLVTEATGTTNWTADLTLTPGTNTVQVTSVNRFGKESKPVVRSWFYSVSWPISIRTNGPGSITPALNGKSLLLGRGYHLTASPAPGFVFSNWTGSVTSANPSLNFLMQSNYAIIGNFIPNPYLPVKGVYSGLLVEKTNNPTHPRSGSVSVTVTGQGTFSGKVTLGGVPLVLAGKFNLEGAYQQYYILNGGFILLELHLGLGAVGDQITGTISDLGGSWQSELMADRATFNALTNPATAFRGRYHLALPPATNEHSAKIGYGLASLTIENGGTTRLSGTLGDGTALLQNAALGKTGRWPFYSLLYAGRGSVFGWLQLTNESGILRPAGQLTWTKTAVAGRFYPAGFTNRLELISSKFIAPAKGQRVLDVTNAIFKIFDGNLSMETNSTLTITTNNLAVVTSTNLAKLAVTLIPSTGLVSGTFIHPNTLRATPFKAIVLQQQKTAYGWFLGTNLGGGLSITAE